MASNPNIQISLKFVVSEPIKDMIKRKLLFEYAITGNPDIIFLLMRL